VLPTPGKRLRPNQLKNPIAGEKIGRALLLMLFYKDVCFEIKQKS
jgi:hypothetical protein